MRLMGLHSRPIDGVAVANGHHVLTPLTIPPSLLTLPDAARVDWPQDTAGPDVKPGKWDRVKSGFRFIFARRGWLAAIPIVLVNAVAFGAQLGFWRAHVPLTAEAVMVALALESIAVYLAYEAHLAQLADDSALRLRLAAYGMALGIGALNYSHFDGPHWRPTVPAVTFGLMSAISPWLWSVHSRRVSRDALMVLNKIEPHAVRLGGTRWAWHPVRSVRVMSRATWTGETDPAAVVATWQPRKTAADQPVDAPADVTPDVVPEVHHEELSDEKETAPLRPLPEVVKPVKVQPRQRAAPPSARARVIALLKKEPALGDTEVIKRLKVSKSTVERARAVLAKETT